MLHYHSFATKKLTTLLWCSLLVMYCGTDVLKAQNTGNPWLLDFSTHMVDYTAVDPVLKGYFDVEDWNFTPFFSKLTLGRTLGPSIALATSVSAAGLNKNPAESNAKNTFVDWDLTLRYKLANNYILKETSPFDPYLFFGGGLNHYNGNNSAAINGGAGINFWFHENAAINVQSAFDNVFEEDNYLHHSVGIATRFGKGNDTDGDGISDKEDICPNDPGPAATDGCPDKDMDGVADKNDNCPTEKGLIALSGCPDKDEDGVPDKTDACPDQVGSATLSGCPDSDGDGVGDNLDQCPNRKGTIAMNGCPDTDGDGVADNFDNCPNTAGAASNKGCPVLEDMEIKKIEEKLQFSAKSIQFETGKAAIKASSYKVLDEIIATMKEYSGTNFSIEGHTDSQGSKSINLDLSTERAIAVLDYFVSKGVNFKRLSASGYGEVNPIADNNTAAGRAINRRVEIKVSQ